MLYPWLQGDVDCTYESIHLCRRYSTHPLGVNEYDTAYAWHKGSAHGDTSTLCMDRYLRVHPPA